MRSRGTQLAVLAAVAAGLILPGGVGAAVTIGSDLSAAPDGTSIVCSAGCTQSNAGIVPARTASGGFTAPADGVVVRWRISAGPQVGQDALRILRPGSSTTRTGAGTGILRSPAANAISTFDERLPIKAGDVLGVDPSPVAQSLAYYEAGNPALLQWNPGRLADGETPRAPNTMAGPGELLINADIEPDADGDGYGDETQDLCPEDADFHVACARIKVNLTGDGVVRAPGIDCPGDCAARFAAGTAVTLTAFDGQGRKFAGFTGACAGGSPCLFTTIADDTVNASFLESDPPETTISTKPKKKSSKRSQQVAFGSDEPGSTFECSLDDGAFHACKSPEKLEVGKGRHTFRVRATDLAGNVDGTPAFANFRVTGKKK